MQRLARESVRVLDREDVSRLLDPDALVESLSAALVSLSKGEASMPDRNQVSNERGNVYLMGASTRDSAWMTAKLVSQFSANKHVPTHHAVVVVFDAETGQVAAVMDGESITAARTAAISRLATRVLARPAARTLAILGTGVQGKAHVRALVRDRSFDDIRLMDSNVEHAAEAAASLASELGITARCARTAAEALDGADIVCVATGSHSPVVKRNLLAAGTHVNSVGYNQNGREIDAATVRDALVVVECASIALNDGAAGSNDLRWPIRDGIVPPDHMHIELGALLSGEKVGRSSDDQITLFKSIGIAISDHAAATLVIERAQREHVGRTITL